MARYTYRIEVHARGEWRPILTEPLGYLRGYLSCHRSAPGPRLGMRIVREDDRVLDSCPAARR